ncbi:MAG: EAL domain-containing protein [Paracoccaceae bacterium]|nr:EAL domain-containing protein [Paracoccaceae bacterium]
MRTEKIQQGSIVTTDLIAPDTTDASAGSLVAVERLKTAIWIYDIDHSRIVFANPSACKLWQADCEVTLRARDLTQDMSPAVAKRLKQYQNDFIERDATFSEMWTLYPNGKPTSVRVIFRGHLLADGRMAMQCEVIGRADDEPENLRSAEALLHTDVMIALHDLNGPPHYMNPAARNTATHAAQTISEKFIDRSDYETLRDEVERSGEYRIVSKVNTSAGPRWHDLTAKRCLDAATGNPAILVTAIDVSELKTARDKARYLAERDQLTGCFNRAYLQQHLVTLEQRPSRRSALLCFDVDRFKQINDRLGHEMGDVVLQEIAKRTTDVIGPRDILVRLGGDEFVVVIEDASSEEILSEKIDFLLGRLGQPIFNDATRVSTSVSVGISTFSTSSVDFASTMREADIALYASKQAGRNRATYFSHDMGVRAKARDLVEIQLKQAVENREFTLHFQPRVNLQTGKVVSVEALVRWVHPRRGLIMPSEFIAICEETGLIEDLGQLVVELACTQAISWHRSGLEIDMSVNISPRQFENYKLLQSLEKFSQHPEFPRGKVELEITENVLIGDHDLIEEKLAAISQMGYRIAIDDFGTGYSNLSYISRFPLNCLKIDQSFISQLPKSGPIIDLIVTLGKQIGATIVAEGVETEKQLQWLADHSCDEVQGFFLSPPIPIEELKTAIRIVNLSV